MLENTPQSALDRRSFVKTGVAVSTGLVIAFYLPEGGRFAGMAQAAEAAPKSYPPNAFIKIAPDNSVTILINKSEMGQGVYTSLAQMICEELDCDWSKVRSESAPVAPVYNHTLFGMQMTGGSTAVVSSYDQHRMIGATGRALLIAAAADTWKVPSTALKTENGFVIDPKSGKKLSYGELADKANSMPAPTDVKLKDPKAFKLIGKGVHRLDAKMKVNGSGQFGLDVRLPGMVYAVVARAPAFGAKLKSFDGKAAKAVKGVVDVFEIPTGVAVVANSTWAAQQGRNALVTEWDFSGSANVTSSKIKSDFAALAQTPGATARPAPQVDDALKNAASVIDAKFDFPYLAHATMEPLNCTIDYDGTKANIYVGTHMQTADWMTAVKILGLTPDKVQLQTTLLGGSFGRRANPNADFVSQACTVAKALKKPVQIVWTRQDDMQGGYYRPAVHHAVKVGLDKAGVVTAWKHTIVSPSIVAGTPFEAMMLKDGVDVTCVEGVADTPYGFPNMHVDLHLPKLPVPVQWWRSVGHSHTAFVMESLVDELAAAAKMDPIEYRLKMLAKHPRQVAVLKLVRDKSDWTKPLPKGHARGVAVHESFGSVVAHVAEVSMENGQPRVHRVVSAVHCGRVINPNGAAAQVESGVIYGLSAALYGAITLKDGRPDQANFDTYRVMMGYEAPKVEAHFVQTEDHPTGLGEPGTPPIGPAVASAIAKLTGKRVRALPMVGGEAST